VDPVPDIDIRLIGDEVGPGVEVHDDAVDIVAGEPVMESLDHGALAAAGGADEVNVMHVVVSELVTSVVREKTMNKASPLIRTENAIDLRIEH
jgi:hypothetical protein